MQYTTESCYKPPVYNDLPFQQIEHLNVDVKGEKPRRLEAFSNQQNLSTIKFAYVLALSYQQ